MNDVNDLCVCQNRKEFQPMDIDTEKYEIKWGKELWHFSQIAQMMTWIEGKKKDRTVSICQWEKTAIILIIFHDGLLILFQW